MIGTQQVYPRVYGGTREPVTLALAVGGLSPRVRGNPADDIGDGNRLGSIPACTGEPAIFCKASAVHAVYPRVYGGTRGIRDIHMIEYGLSPRVRGNRDNLLCLRDRMGSIPACTGEPPPVEPTAILETVYPRVYGGTLVAL